MPVAIVIGLAVCLPALAEHDSLDCTDCHVPSATAKVIDPVALEQGRWSAEQTRDGVTGYRLYDSPTLDAGNLSQPNGSARLCLGCHDGTSMSFSTAAGGPATFGPADLALSHPVSFTYDSTLAMIDPELRDPRTTPSGTSSGGTIADDLLDDRGRMQCTACHDPHGDPAARVTLRWPYDGWPEDLTSACRVCHVK